MVFMTLWWTPKCSTIKVSTTQFVDVLYTYIYSFKEFDTSVELNMFFTLVVIVVELVEVQG